MSKEEFDAIMADSHDTMVDNRIDTAWGIISKLQAEVAELRDILEEITEIEERQSPTIYSSGWNDALKKCADIIKPNSNE